MDLKAGLDTASRGGKNLIVKALQEIEKRVTFGLRVKG
jgi:hypothetical protein